MSILIKALPAAVHSFLWDVDFLLPPSKARKALGAWLVKEESRAAEKLGKLLYVTLPGANVILFELGSVASYSPSGRRLRRSLLVQEFLREKRVHLEQISLNRRVNYSQE